MRHIRLLDLDVTWPPQLRLLMQKAPPRPPTFMFVDGSVEYSKLGENRACTNQRMRCTQLNVLNINIELARPECSGEFGVAEKLDLTMAMPGRSALYRYHWGLS